MVQPISPHLEVSDVSAVQFVCDTMLQGLGMKLRRCGMDTVILNNFEDHMECVKLYQNEKRFILTRGHVFDKVI